MNSTLAVRADDLAEDEVQQILQDLCRTINDETEIRAAQASTTGGLGTKGDPITLGTIALAFITSGAAIKLLSVLKTAVGRKSSLKFELSASDGEKLVLNAENLGSAHFEQTLQLADRFLKKA